ncbi:lysophospholipid acyltransferase family protein [Lacimicrobium alkaliphilum]|nr:GNAT family N-acyltransferase [Lacimicrobium alkaliphilum]
MSPILDRCLGISAMQRIYHQQGFSGLNSQAFCQKYIDYFRLSISGANVTMYIPVSGPVLIVANHPLGGMEGVVLLNMLRKVRPDIKILANRALGLLEPLAPHFIYTNPLKTNDKGNQASVRACHTQLENGGALLIFPAGRVSYSVNARSPVTDHPWNKLVGSLGSRFNCPVVPVYISGQNRRWFYRLGHIWKSMRMLMLIREMLASKDRRIHLAVGQPVNRQVTREPAHLTRLFRLLTYLQNPGCQTRWGDNNVVPMMPLAKPVSGRILADELMEVPGNQKLLSYKNLAVYYLNYDQAPLIVEEIRRLRELQFREYKEGSGKDKDGDQFDHSYTHLVLFDTDTLEVAGAYRMGRTDQLLEGGDITQLYLSRMFDFGPGFVNRHQPCLEMGRSFLIGKHQRSFHGLLLLFKGIGAFLQQFKHYRTLYGTVSLSKIYTPLSVYLIQRFVVCEKDNVRALKSFDYPVIPELEAYLKDYARDIDVLDWLIKHIEPDGKGLPVLVRQYHQLGARFHGLGMDPNFAGTPGLLLSVDVAKAPEKLLRLYLGNSYQAWLNY